MSDESDKAPESLYSELCKITHEKLLAGKCPWCGKMICDPGDESAIDESAIDEEVWATAAVLEFIKKHFVKAKKHLDWAELGPWRPLVAPCKKYVDYLRHRRRRFTRTRQLVVSAVLVRCDEFSAEELMKSVTTIFKPPYRICPITRRIVDRTLMELVEAGLLQKLEDRDAYLSLHPRAENIPMRGFE